MLMTEPGGSPPIVPKRKEGFCRKLGESQAGEAFRREPRLREEKFPSFLLDLQIKSSAASY